MQEAHEPQILKGGLPLLSSRETRPSHSLLCLLNRPFVFLQRLRFLRRRVPETRRPPPPHEHAPSAAQRRKDGGFGEEPLHGFSGR
ncbi:hypothetical protein KSP39_PZI016978 [Platanthera zijinensis]|uniref:Uncharacterized protein n=1 Tax=Platanthera zijinensis TaxID=2320716 RepID=A0AAP0G0L0_9ASPA